MQKRYDIEIRLRNNFVGEIFRISNMLHNDAAHYIVVRAKQHQSIHKFRVCLKKLRGIIRLLRDEIGVADYRELNTYYKNIAQKVGQLRDYTSQIVLLKDMQGQLKNSLLQTTIKASIRKLLQQRENDYRLFLKQGEDAQLKELVLLQKDRFQNLEFQGKPDIFIGSSLRKVYRKGQTIQANSALWENPRVFHSWRKQVKYLMFQLMLLNQIWTKQLSAHIGELNSLQKTLGKLHDMHLFRDILEKNAAPEMSNYEKTNILRLITKKESAYIQKADLLGRQLFAESSRGFSNRIYKLWMIKQTAEHPID